MNTMNRINAMIDMNDINFQLRIKFLYENLWSVKFFYELNRIDLKDIRL